ncbi:MAG: methylated-DNA--[protein]-cysteine S-methyltransferase, partial [Gammaproteobacteria bacterium]
AGRLNAFDVPLAPHGTPFQQSVWRALLTIPYGALRTYQDVADAIGRPTAVRAVANAIGANPIAIMIPCHRVIGRNRQLTGFGGGLVNKRILLEREGHKMTDATDLKRAKVI